jgi:tetratricopeptide (TPR) repeat protein
MKRSGFVIASMLLGEPYTILLAARAPGVQQESVAAQDPAPDLATLQLSDVRKGELQDAIRRRDYKRAESILVDEAEKDPGSLRSARLLVVAGGVFFLNGEYLNSATAWKKAEAITPLDDRSRFTLAMAFVRLKRGDWARTELEKLAAAHPQDSLYQYWLARLDYDAQEYAAAIARLQKLIELDPDIMRAYDTLGLCYDYMGRFDEAIKAFNRAVELNRLQSKPSPWPNLDLAVTLISVNQWPEAEENIREALTYDTRLPQAHYQLGRVLEMQGSYPAAVQSLNQAIELEPTYPQPHYLLGRIYHRLGKEDVSKKEIARFQQLKKDYEAQHDVNPHPSPK